MDTRIERDFLGEVAVPSEAYWGAQTQRALELYAISGRRSSPDLAHAIALIKRAAARTFRELGLLDPMQAQAIDDAAKEVQEGRWDEQIVVDVFQAGAGTSLHMNLNELIANRANELLGSKLGSYSPIHPNDQVNMGQSTNDVFPTAMRLAALEQLSGLDQALDRVEKSLRSKASAFDSILKAGRTHLQDAVPIRLGQEFGAYASTIARSRRALLANLDALSELGLGGTAVGTGLNTPVAYRTRVVEELRHLTGHHGLHATHDYFETMQSMVPFTMLSSTLRNLAIELNRIANDLRLLSSGPRTGLHEIVLPAVQPGSSIMPGKLNPSIPEMLNQVCFQVLGNDAAIAGASQAGQLELNVMMPVIAENLLFSLRILRTSLQVFAKRCLEGIEVDAVRCKANAENSVALATVLNPLIGYSQAAEVTKEALKRNEPIPRIIWAKGLLSEEQLAKVFEPRHLTEPSA